MTNWDDRVNPSHLADKNAFDHDMYGVEVEVEYNHTSGANLPDKVKQFWSCVPDGSLRTYGKVGDCAAEFRYTKPLNGYTSALAVKQLCQVLNADCNEIYNSGRTSTHVHVNVLNINRLQVMNLITLAIIFDELLVDQHHPFRAGNLFALRFKDAEGPIRFLIHQLAFGGNFRNFSNNNYRYASVNLTSIGRFGTIEFRAMDGELNHQRINQWVFCLHQLKRWAVKYKNPREIVDKFNKMGALQFMREHIPPYYTLNMDPGRAMEMLQRGIIMAADLAYCSDWQSKVIVEPQIKVRGGKNPFTINYEQSIAQAQAAMYPPVPAPPSPSR